MQYKKGRRSPWVVQVRDANGDLQTSSFIKKDDAIEFEENERRKRQLQQVGLNAPMDSILLLDYSKTFLSRRYASMPAGTVNQDEARLRNYWLETFGLRPLQTITAAEIKERLDHIQFELEHSSGDRNRHRALMHKLFQDAFMDNKVLFNPVAKIPLVDEVATRSSGTIAPEVQKKYIAGLYAINPRYGMLGDLMLWTGARIMAAAAIQYRDVDFENGVVYIRRLRERATGEVVNRTKGSGSDGAEVVPLFQTLRDAILTHRKASDYSRPSDFIACAPDGKAMPYETFRDVHATVVKSLTVDRFTPHALRKAFATNAKRAGFSRSEIREMLGHSSDAMTEKYDLKDIEHLVEKGRRLGFGKSVQYLKRVNHTSTKAVPTRRTKSAIQS